ncbi:MAG: hypothetical protein QW046_01335 [Candidatus Micrarchaeaceae archaeon]
MRSADAVTIGRIPIMFLLVYMIIFKFNAFVDIIIIALIFLMDALDGYFAVREASGNSVSFSEYVMASLGKSSAKARIKKIKESVSKIAPYGPRLDIAGDRIIEYSFWILFTYLSIVPLYILLLIVIRHSLADALMGARGTSSKLKTKFARVIYSSALFRGGINVAKFVTFSYLVLVYLLAYPIWIGYLLIGILFTYIMVRGAAEIYEGIKEKY